MLLLFLPTTLCTLSTSLAWGRQFPLVQSKEEANVDMPYCLQP